jgi:putative restriction endonuclease
MFESLLESFNKLGLRFFIFDSKNDHLIYGDKDFDEYHWDQARNNRPRVGDFFLYRRPQKASEVKG